MLDPYVAWTADVTSRPVVRRPSGAWVGPEIEGDLEVDNGTVYVGSPDNKVYAFDAFSGEERWRFDAEDAVRSGIAIDRRGETIFFGTDNNGFFAVNTEDGTEAWHWPDRDRIAVNFPAKPTVYEDLVIAGSSGGYVFGWQQADGDHAEWTFPDPDDDEEKEEFSHSGYAVANDIYFGNEDGFLYVIDVDNGTLRMAARTLSPANHDYPYQREQGCREKPIPDGADCRGKKIATEVVRHDDGVVFGTDAKQLYLYSTPSGGIEWVYEAQGNILGDIAVDDNLIIFAERGGTIVAIDTDESRNLRRKDTDDGEAFDRMRAEWTESTEQDNEIVAGPVIHGEMAYWIDREGILYGYVAQTGREKFRISLWEGDCRRCHSKPFVVGDMLYAVTADGFLKAIRLPD